MVYDVVESQSSVARSLEYGLMSSFSLCDLQMDDQSVRVGAPLYYPCICRHCYVTIDEQATHGLGCRWSEGHHPRHAAINDIIFQSLASAKVPSQLEANGLYHSDSKRLNSIT